MTVRYIVTVRSGESVFCDYGCPPLKKKMPRQVAMLSSSYHPSAARLLLQC